MGPLDAGLLRLIQLDDVSEPADALARLLRERARFGSAAGRLARRLDGWSGSMSADHPQALVAGVALIQLCRVALVPALGAAAPMALGKPPLNPLSSASMLLGRAPSALVAALERHDTAFWKALGHDDEDTLLEQAAAAAERDLESRLGSRHGRARWGDVHALQLRHPLARGGRMLAAIFGSKRLALSGDSDTPCQSGCDRLRRRGSLPRGWAVRLLAPGRRPRRARPGAQRAARRSVGRAMEPPLSGPAPELALGPPPAPAPRARRSRGSGRAAPAAGARLNPRRLCQWYYAPPADAGRGAAACVGYTRTAPPSEALAEVRHQQNRKSVQNRQESPWRAA